MLVPPLDGQPQETLTFSGMARLTEEKNGLSSSVIFKSQSSRVIGVVLSEHEKKAPVVAGAF